MIKILIVDDEPEICESIKKPFAYLGFTVFTATTAKKALNIFEKNKPKIIFLDIIMPDRDGLELLKKFKELDPKVIVIMVTAKGGEETRKKAIALGADDFMTKGFSFEDLRDISRKKIEMLLGKAGHMQKPRILIVDDEDQARDNLRNFITPLYECDIEEAQDGESAIEKVQKMQPDVVLLDVRMPGVDGIRAIEEIKEISPDSRIIVISGHGTPDVVSKAMALGAFDYLVKPIDFELFPERFEPALISMGKLIKKT